MGKGGGGGDPQVIQATRDPLPNENLLQDYSKWRLHASAPYMSSPYRVMDFAQNYTVPGMQLPTFTNSSAYSPYGLNSIPQPAGYSGNQGMIASQINSYMQPSAGVQPSGKGNFGMGPGMGNKGSLILNPGPPGGAPSFGTQAYTSPGQPSGNESGLGRRTPQEAPNGG